MSYFSPCSYKYNTANYGDQFEANSIYGHMAGSLRVRLRIALYLIYIPRAVEILYYLNYFML